jgi:hypothetical protein
VATLKTNPADNKIINSALNFDVPKNMARLYLINGNCDVMFKNMKCISTNSIFINKKLIGGLNERDVMVVDLKPGKYEILHNYNNDYELKSFGTVNIPLEINLNAGQYEIVQFTVFEGGSSLLTALMNPYKYISEFSKDKSLIQDKNFIVPIN